MTELEILSAELATDPVGIGYATMTDAEVCLAIMANTRPRVVSRHCTWRTMFAELGPTATATIKAKIESAAQSNPVLKIAGDMLATYSDGGGLDVGHANTHAALDGLVTALVLSKAEADGIKSMAVEFTTRYLEIGLHVLAVTPEIVAACRT